MDLEDRDLYDVSWWFKHHLQKVWWDLHRNPLRSDQSPAWLFVQDAYLIQYIGNYSNRIVGIPHGGFLNLGYPYITHFT